MATTVSDFIHRFVPTSKSERARTLVLLHGTGGDETDLLDLGRQLAPNANLLGVRGNVLERGAPRFFRRLAEGVFDLDDLEKQTEHLGDFIQSAAFAYGFNRSNLIAVGYSNGANIAGSLLLRRPGLLSGAVLLRAMVPFVPPVAPDLRGTPVFIGAGSNDPLVSLEETKRLAALFQEASAVVTLALQEAGHYLITADMAAAQHWLTDGKEK